MNPAELSRPAIGLTTPVLSHKSITVGASSLQKTPKVSNAVPARIDLEPVYAALKAAIGSDQWPVYKETTSQFLVGRLTQAEFSERVDPILLSANGEKEHLHNQLIAAIYGNVTREMPDQGLAPWVSANDKPSATAGSKPVTGDATERRVKGEVMQLPARDRRRIKDLATNEIVDPHEALAGVFSEHHRAKAPRTQDVPQSAAGGLNRMNWDLEIRKRYAQPLAVESGEFPDTSNVEARMLPFCYESGLVSGHAPEAAGFVSVAAEVFIKEVLSAILCRTRSNGPGELGGGSSNITEGTTWIQTHKYRKQLAREEESARRGELSRDKSGLLPVEARSASEQGPVGMADLQLALDMGECGMANFPLVSQTINYSYREGELEAWEDYTWIGGEPPKDRDGDTRMTDASAKAKSLKTAIGLPNGVPHEDAMDVDNSDDDIWWEGADFDDSGTFDNVLDACLTA
ncbi:hypothetical protein PspLS_05064 [Pyricularia sp. CBS 133598]|nr:hypothetical protein PspLS_05064 [Pyricularia sp. CBS 133598]